MQILNEVKINLLRELERQGILREEKPFWNGELPGVYYWRFGALKPEALPDSLKEEYNRLGELRW
mgnify:CR=1 FL=1